MHNTRICVLNLGFLRINRLSFSIHPTLQVLDIGCGTGGSAFFIARHYGCSVRGLDMSPTMIAIANEYRQSHTDNYSQIITYRFYCPLLYEQDSLFKDTCFRDDPKLVSPSVKHRVEFEVMEDPENARFHKNCYDFIFR